MKSLYDAVQLGQFGTLRLILCSTLDKYLETPVEVLVWGDWGDWEVRL